MTNKCMETLGECVRCGKKITDWDDFLTSHLSETICGGCDKELYKTGKLNLTTDASNDEGEN